MKVWVFQTGEPLHIDGDNVRPMRAMNLSDKLVQAGHSVVLWSADFYHQEKRHRYGENRNIKVSENLQIRLLPSKGYTRNIGPGRMLDHLQLARNLKKQLSVEDDLPDVAFIGYPPIEPAAVFTRWLKKKSVPCLLDIKDQWPSIFIDALPRAFRPVGAVVFWPYFYFARRAMNDATGVVAMAESFLLWALNFSSRKRSDNDAIFPLTVPASLASGDELDAARKWWDDMGVKQDARPKIFFVGSLSPAFDFLPIKEAALLAEQSGDSTQFVICGEGDASGNIKSMMSGLSNVFFAGWVDRPKIDVLAERCIAALAPYLNINNFTTSIPNKVVDAMSLGVPILSPLQGEVAALISKYSIGVQYGTDTGKTLYDNIQTLIQDPDYQVVISKNARALYDEQFSFEIVYSSLVNHLEKVAATTDRVD